MMKSSIRELKEIVKKNKTETWIQKNIYRKLSIYFSLFFIKLGVSGNQVSVIKFCVGIISGIFFLYKSPIFWIIGGLVVFLHYLLDYVDGQIARYNKTSSVFGAWVDQLGHLGIKIYLLSCMTFGLYYIFYDVRVFIFGFIAVILHSYNAEFALSPYPILYSRGLLAKSKDEWLFKNKNEEIRGRSMTKLGSFALHFNGMISLILITSFVDIFLRPVMILSGFMINARYMCIIIYELVMFVGIIIKVYVTNKHMKLFKNRI